MKLLILPSWYPCYEGDPNGSFFQDQARAIAKTGIHTTVCAPLLVPKKQIRPQHLSRLFSIQYSFTENLHTFEKAFTLLKGGLLALEQKRFRKVLFQLFDHYVAKFGLPDLIHVHSWTHAGPVALELKEKYKIPYVITEHSTQFQRALFSPQQLREATKIYHNAAAFLCVSQSLLKSIESCTQQKFPKSFCLPNMVQEDFFNISPKPTKNFVFGCVGMLTPKKNHKLLIQSFAQAFAKEKDLQLHIAGDGPEFANLKALLKELNMEKQVFLLGKIDRQQMPSFYQTINAFVLPSDFETFGVVVLEAMAAGLPVLATICGGPEEFVSQESGLLVPVQDQQALCLGLQEIFQNQSKYRPAAISKKCHEEFSGASLAKKLTSLYQEILGVPQG